MRTAIATLSLIATLTLGGATSALAGSGSLLTLGVGGGVGVLHEKQPGATTESTFVNQANVRLKLLYFLGVDYGVDLSQDASLKRPSDELQLAAKMRLTALIYAIPTKMVSLYLGFGTGGGDLADLVSLTNERNSYHAGLGLEVHLSDHVTFDISYYMIIPGVRSVERHVEELALASAQAQSQAGGGAPGSTGVGVSTGDEATVGDFITPQNFELMVRVFLFL